MEEEIKENQLYHIRFTAKVLGVSVQTLRNWDNEEKFKSVRTVGKHRRYLGQEILNKLQKTCEGEK